MTHHRHRTFIPKRNYIQIEVIGTLTSSIIDLSHINEKPHRGKILAMGPDVDHEALKVGDIVRFSPQLKYPNIEFEWHDARTRVIQQADIEFVEDPDDVTA